MTPAEYLDAAKAAMGIESDYALAKRLDINKARIHDWRTGKSAPDAFACTLIAIALEVDPATVIADIHAQTDNKEKRREFWRSFLSRARAITAVLCTLASIFSATYGSEQAGAGRPFKQRRIGRIMCIMSTNMRTATGPCCSSINAYGV